MIIKALIQGRRGYQWCWLQKFSEELLGAPEKLGSVRFGSARDPLTASVGLFGGVSLSS